MAWDVKAEVFSTNVRVDDTGSSLTDQKVPKIAVHGDDVYVVWEDHRSGGSEIYFAKSTNKGMTFEPNKRVCNDPLSMGQANPAIAVDTNGHIYVVWEDFRGISLGDIYFAKSTDGGDTFGWNIRVDDDTSNSAASFPSISVGGGIIGVAWKDERDSLSVYFANSTDGGLTFGINRKVNDVSAVADKPSIAVDDTGSIFAVWNDNRAGNDDIYFSKSGDGGNTFSSNVRINDDIGTATQGIPVVAVGGGIIGVAWSDGRGGLADIYFANSTDGGGTFGINKRVNSNTPGHFHSEPSIAISRIGYIGIAWRDNRSDDLDVYFANSSDGGDTFSVDQSVNDDMTSENQWGASVLSIGKAVYITWQDHRNGNWDIYFARSGPPPPMAIPISPLNGSVITDNTPTLTVTPVGDPGGDTIHYNFTISDQPDAESGTPHYSGWVDSPNWTAPILTDGRWYWHTYTSDIWSITAPNWVWNFIINTSYADLVVTEGDLALEPLGPVESEPVRINATIHNIGRVVSGATAVRFYEGVPPAPLIGADQPLAPIPAGGQINVSIIWTPSASGLRDVCVVADPENIIVEIDKSNNMACVPVQVLSLPDLKPVSIATIPPSPIIEGTPSQVNVTIVNAGDLPAGGFDVLLFDDSNGNLVPDPGEDIGVHAMTGIAGHSQSYEEFSWTAAPAGAHSLCAYADPPPGTVRESNESNNVMCIDVLVQLGPILRPDYVPVAPLPLPPIKVGLSSRVSFSMQVRNQGNGTATDNAIVAFHEQSSPPFSSFLLSPLAPATTSSRFTATWTTPAVAGTYLVSVDVDYTSNVTEWDETNNVFTWTVEVVAGPITSLDIGNPNHTATLTYVRSSTPLDFSVTDQSGLGIRNTTYRIDGGDWKNYTATGQFSLAGEGQHRIEWHSTDFAGNVESVNSQTLNVDDTPPATTILVCTPRHQAAELYVTSSTPINLTSTDGGAAPVGLARTEYQIDGGGWFTYASNITLAGADGPRMIEYRSIDLLGNTEEARNITVILDDTPPATAIDQSDVRATTDTVFNLAATDTGCGVNVTMYRIDGGQWLNYALGFTLPEGTHNISYYSRDMLNNTEEERWLVVTVSGVTQPPSPDVLSQYWWLVLLIVAVVSVLAFLFLMKRKKPKEEEPPAELKVTPPNDTSR